MQTKITVNQWHELPEYTKETLRKWAVKRGFGLELIPNNTADMCDYAALLSISQMKLFLGETRNDKTLNEEELPDDYNYLWQEIQRIL